MNCIRVMVFIGIIYILTAIVIFCICYFKKIIVKIYNKWKKRGMLSQNIAYPIGEIYKDINCKSFVNFKNEIAIALEIARNKSKRTVKLPRRCRSSGRYT